MNETAIQNAMEAARLFLNSTEERRQYINREMARMDYESRLQLEHREGFQKGCEEGRQKGRQKGRQEEAIRFSKLIQMLLSKGDMNEINAVTSDPTKREMLYEKYHIT